MDWMVWVGFIDSIRLNTSVTSRHQFLPHCQSLAELFIWTNYVFSVVLTLNNLLNLTTLRITGFLICFYLSFLSLFLSLSLSPSLPLALPLFTALQPVAKKTGLFFARHIVIFVIYAVNPIGPIRTSERFVSGSFPAAGSAD